MGHIVKVLDQPPYIVSCDADFDMYMDASRRRWPVSHQTRIGSMREALELATAEKRPEERKIILIIRGTQITVSQDIYRRILLRDDAGTIGIKCKDQSELLAHREVLRETSGRYDKLLSLRRNQQFITIPANNNHPLAVRLLLRFLYDNYIEVPETLLVEFNKLVKSLKIRAMDQITIFSKNDWYSREVGSIDFSQDFVMEPLHVYDFDRTLAEKNENKSKSNSIEKNEIIQERINQLEIEWEKETGFKIERSRKKDRGSTLEREREKESGNKPERGRERDRGTKLEGESEKGRRNNLQRDRLKKKGNKLEKECDKEISTKRKRDSSKTKGDQLERVFSFTDVESVDSSDFLDSSDSSESSDSVSSEKLVKEFQLLCLKCEDLNEDTLKKLSDKEKVNKQSGFVTIVEIEEKKPESDEKKTESDEKKPESDEKLRLNAEKQRLADALEKVKKGYMNDIEAAEKYFVPRRELEKIKKKEEFELKKKKKEKVQQEKSNFFINKRPS